MLGAHYRMWELDRKEGWAPKNWYFWNVVLGKTLEGPLNSKEIKPVNPKRINPEYSLEGLMLSWSSNTLATWCEEPTHWKRTWCWERLKARGEGDDRGQEMVGWQHWLDGHEFEQAPGVGEGQGSLACYTAVLGVAKSQTRLSNWTTTMIRKFWAEQLCETLIHQNLFIIETALSSTTLFNLCK